ncbi:hypothetical protein [Amycolatopsis sp. NPDC051071]|uniref:hypothetical protein n=1 Tax=Amycolatopsis sp. NPDC051071 TaxID=3154637 RepID=UPI00341F62F2
MLYWTVLLMASAGVLFVAASMLGPYPASAKRTIGAAWLAVLAGTVWWATSPGAGPVVVIVVALSFSIAVLNREHQPSSPRTPHQPPR